MCRRHYETRPVSLLKKSYDLSCIKHFYKSHQTPATGIVQGGSKRALDTVGKRVKGVVEMGTCAEGLSWIFCLVFGNRFKIRVDTNGNSLTCAIFKKICSTRSVYRIIRCGRVLKALVDFFA